MDVPGIVRERLGDERRMTSVNVGGDDRVYVTPPKTLVYHASGLFSSESVDEFSHDARRFDVSADRREATFAFEYDGGVEAFSAPRERIETILPPVLAGILRTRGLIDADEPIEESYRFGERTLVVSDARLLTSVGEAIWETDHESYAYENVTDLHFEDGFIIEMDGRSRHIELTGDGRREAYETIETALLAYYGVDSVEELPQGTEQRRQRSESADTTASQGTTSDSAESSERTTRINDAESDSGESIGPLPSSPAPDGEPEPIREAPEPDESETPTETVETTTAEPEETDDTDTTPDLTEELDALRESVEHQTELLERQQETLERLAEELDTERITDDQ